MPMISLSTEQVESLRRGAPVHHHSGVAIIPPSPETHRPIRPLSQRESAVADLLARGVRRKEIAAILGKSYATIDCQVCDIYSKLGVHSQVELMQLMHSVSR